MALIMARVFFGGSITEYAIPTTDSSPLDITTGSDGNLWFTENAPSQIGTVTP
ncbi:hypothetical protein [Kitasatospora cathayae]|uniref:Lyase n=1 Tax=Kitasatospora cathayae TaxID=3004092 RepID=A0ABY7QFF9_9ACTN|nr:hypothetical protein [Kitasatospora sp. HUAS 3-15]WBP91242.1 hypothetical protein O1G21_38765 [Kitasatospora sp. HUAS 3-15]